MLRATQKLLALAVMVCFLAPLLAQNDTDTKTSGKIKSISASKNEFVLTADRDAKDYRFHLDTKGKIQVSDTNRDGRIEDLKVGEEVTVLWRKRDNRNIATEVRCKRK